MEMLKKVKSRKEWVKNALIIFLVIMLILTFCSNSIMNMSLPEVSTEAVTSGKVQENIRGTGTAELANGYQVMLKDSRTVKQVNIKLGQEVKTGDVLFVLEPSDGSELENAKMTYLDLQTEYQKKLLGTEYVYEKEKLAIENAKKDYDNAVKALNSIGKNNKKIAKKKKTLAGYDSKIAKLETAIAGYDEEMTELISKTDLTSLNADLILKKRVVAALNNELADITADLNALVAEGGDGEEIKALERQKRDKELEITNANADVTLVETDIKNADENVRKLASVKSTKEKDVQTLSELKIKQVNLTEEIEALKAATLSETDAQAAADEKENIWNTLVFELEDKQREDDYTKDTEQIELNAAKQRLIAQKSIVEELIKESQSEEVVAGQDGIVSSLTINTGEITQPDTPLAVISSGEGGFKVDISVAKEQALKVKQGQKAEVENYWDGEIKAVVTSVKADVNDPANSIITCEIEAEYVREGDSLAISIGADSQMYDIVVPRSSVYEDNNGKFVLTLDSKSTPLGNRYIATRHNVEVVAQNDTKAAISSDLMGYEYVIVAASEAITPGEQVKLKE